MPARKKKSPTPNLMGKRTDRIEQSSPPLADPVKFEYYWSEDGKRMTRVHYAPPFQAPLVQSADYWMEEARREPGLLMSAMAWHFILPWLESSPGDVKSFWRAFNTEEAEERRRVALYGPKFSKRLNEKRLLGLAHAYKALLLKKHGLGLGADEPLAPLADSFDSPVGIVALMNGLEKQMADWVLDAVWNDAEAPKRLHELLKSKKAAKSEFSDQSNVNAMVFKAFVHEIAGGWRLPTKKIVRSKAGLDKKPRENAGLNDAQKALTQASKAFRALGLGGLPEG